MIYKGRGSCAPENEVLICVVNEYLLSGLLSSYCAPYTFDSVPEKSNGIGSGMGVVQVGIILGCMYLLGLVFARFFSTLSHDRFLVLEQLHRMK